LQFDILYQDEDLIAIHKPYGYFVHRTGLDNKAEEIVLHVLRDQIGQYVYPVHRLDRKTSGLLILALNKDTQKYLNNLFMTGQVHKEYHAIVRGYTPDQELINYSITNDIGKTQEAITELYTLGRSEIQLPHGKFSTSRYSLVMLVPKTGRQHQLRKHMAHIFHPILADRPHGCNKQNKLMLEKFGLNEMMLHAVKLSFTNPKNMAQIDIRCNYSAEFNRMLKKLSLVNEG
jgi:tRNA pseudouridine65 synthase